MSEKEFILSRIKKLTEEELKSFPGAFMNSGKLYQLSLPGKALVIGEHFFDMVEVTTIDGTPFYQTDNYELAKYIVYANRLKPPAVEVPEEKGEIKRINDEYESYLDGLIKGIEKDYKNNFPEGKQKNFVSSEIFRILNLVRY